MNFRNNLIKKIVIILFFISCIFPSNIIKVNAVGWGSDIGGAAAGSSGGGPGGKTSSGFALGGPVLLQVCIVNISHSQASKDSNQCIYFKSSSNWSDYHDLSKKYKKFLWTKNMISSGGFADVSYNFNIGSETNHRIENDSEYGKSAGWWHTSGNWGLLYSATTVQNNFISGGNASDFFQKIAKKLLKQALGWDDTKVNGINFVTLEGLTEDDVTDLANYRIIVEPIYSFSKSGSYYFATLKGIAKAALGNSAYGFATMSNPKDPYLGVSITGLYNNNYSEGTHGVINSNPLPITDRMSYYKKLADINDGRGYGIFFIIPCAEGECPVEITPSCEQQEDKLFCIDGNECSIDQFLVGSSGIASCDCEDITALDKLTNEQRIFYSGECGSPEITLEDLETSEAYTSTLKACNIYSTIPESYRVTHKYTRKLEGSDNKYCTLTCKETIDIKDLTNRFSTLAGKYFEISKPSIDGNKECDIKVYNKKWKNDYDSYINILVNKVNSYQKEYGKDYGIYNEKDAKCPGDEKGEKSGTRYYYNYTRYSYNKSTGDFTDSERSSSYRVCDSDDYPDPDSYINAVTTAFENVEEHLNDLEECNNYLNELSQFYKFRGDLNFYYEQNYKDDVLPTLNNSKPNGEIDDSPLILTPSTDVSSSYIENSTMVDGTSVNYNDTKYTSNSDIYKYIDENGDVHEKAVGTNIKNDNSQFYNIYRSQSYSGNYELSVEKYVETLTGRITTTGNSSTKLLGKVYDTDVSAQIKTNNKNYYQFSTLGDNEEISKVFKSSNGQTINYNGAARNPSSNNDAWLKRTCEYEITNDVICDSANLAMCVNYRMVDPNNIDPNNRLITKTGNLIEITSESAKGFKNWRNVKGVAVYNKITEEDTFNPDNIEYSFTLDSATIKKIRDYTNGYDTCDEDDTDCLIDNRKTYDNISDAYLTLTCNDEGNECISSFITELTKENGEFGKKIANSTKGRDMWKYLIYDGHSSKWEIKEYDKGTMTSDIYNGLLESSNYDSKGVTP